MQWVLVDSIKQSVQVSIVSRSFDLDLKRVVCSRLCHTPIDCDFPRHANVLAAVRPLRITEFRSITAPNHYGEDLTRIRLIEIEECRTSPSSLRVV